MLGFALPSKEAQLHESSQKLILGLFTWPDFESIYTDYIVAATT